MNALLKYIRNVLIAVDQFANAVLMGDPDETLSSRAGKAARRREGGFWHGLAWLLEKIDHGHNERSIEDDEGADAVWMELIEDHSCRANHFRSLCLCQGADPDGERMWGPCRDRHARWVKFLRDAHAHAKRRNKRR